ncbi:unnamed protein product [Oppiella nova]|uniref:Uncharacterized protein n=1 Tax=Oppiella nova TaxID=334625 RepID=A0A7R9QR15_9ACAR|nr:unnamed protein product [Oppiella nova]CAG2172459.1 unnamed protein product [Oppiella nova]
MRRDCEYIKGDVERYNECANRDYGEHHKRLSNHRSHYKKDRKQGHRNCYKDFQESMRSFNQEGGYNKFNQCFRNNLNKEHIRRCENNEYE